MSGVVRPNTQSGRATSLEAALRTPRTARSARPSTSQNARTVRLGTASMMSQPDGPFIQVIICLCSTLVVPDVIFFLRQNFIFNNIVFNN